MLAVSMNCLSPVSCKPNVGSVLWIVLVLCLVSPMLAVSYGLSFVLCLVSPMLAVSMNCLSPVSYKPNVGSVYGLS